MFEIVFRLDKNIIPSLVGAILPPPLLIIGSEHSFEDIFDVLFKYWLDSLELQVFEDELEFTLEFCDEITCGKLLETTMLVVELLETAISTLDDKEEIDVEELLIDEILWQLFA